MEGQLYLSSPELAFLQMHDHASDFECIALGFELCGTYTRIGADAMAYDIAPATSADKIRRFLHRVHGMRHRSRALRNLGHIKENSASPRETQLAMILGLPTRLGGYGLADFELNAPIDVPATTKFPWRRDVRRADISWPRECVAVEYDSDEFHVGAEKIARDAERRTLLQAAGYDLVVVTNSQFKRTSELDRICAVLYRLLGRRWRCRMPEYLMRKEDLHRRVRNLSI
ncbi:hypothetical protein VJ918_02795 [Adlercreutzia sp. R21]|uniref:hypothetical protein n=1 Tax=Adlercreutzia wanghongyangiae TaxID=3111451 RepID=UPI002DBD0F64|nr:hypothetical protein [Adlercreutzia sp. R21]MEC4183730.1 hypothetical protein [Adlercreutzia sp. R21]